MAGSPRTRRITITIALSGGAQEETAAWSTSTPGLAVQQHAKAWAITHIPSGMLLTGYRYRTRTEALTKAAALGGLLDWTVKEPHVLTCTRCRGRRRLRSGTCPDCDGLGILKPTMQLALDRAVQVAVGPPLQLEWAAGKPGEMERILTERVETTSAVYRLARPTMTVEEIAAGWGRRAEELLAEAAGTPGAVALETRADESLRRLVRLAVTAELVAHRDGWGPVRMDLEGSCARTVRDLALDAAAAVADEDLPDTA